MTVREYVARELIKAWFPRRWDDESWASSQDGQAWIEISILDAEVAIKAYEEFFGDDLK